MRQHYTNIKKLLTATTMIKPRIIELQSPVYCISPRNWVFKWSGFVSTMKILKSDAPVQAASLFLFSPVGDCSVHMNVCALHRKEADGFMRRIMSRLMLKMCYFYLSLYVPGVFRPCPPVYALALGFPKASQRNLPDKTLPPFLEGLLKQTDALRMKKSWTGD